MRHAVAQAIDAKKAPSFFLKREISRLLEDKSLRPSRKSRPIREKYPLAQVVAAGGLLAFSFQSSAAVPQESPTSTGTAIEEVIVTAERREASAQTVALPLTVLSGEELLQAGIAAPEDMNKLVPGLKMTNGTFTSIYIRGVGENAAYSGAQSAIAFSVDGIYVGRLTAISPNFFDLERIEVLKGPQGTLYGRNATGGAVNAISAKPTDTFGGYVNLDLGDYNLQRVTAAVNVPVTDTFALRGAIRSSQRDGYLSDGRQDDNTLAVRLSSLWRPSDSVTAHWVIDGSRQKGLGDGGVIYNAATGEITDIGGSDSPEAIASRIAKGNIQALPIPSELRSGPGIYMENLNTSLQVDWDVGLGTLTFQPGYRKHEWYYNNRSTFGYGDSGGKADQISGEIRFANEGEKLKYVAGLFYFNEELDDNQLQIIQFTGGAIVRNWYKPVETFSTESHAAFGEATYSLTDSFRLTAGIRFTQEDREIDLTANGWGSAFAPSLIGNAGDFQPDPYTGVVVPHYAFRNQASPSWDNTSGKVGFEYDLRPQSMLYASVATGFKSGGFSLSPAPQDVYRPEELTAITLGVKNRFFGDSLQLNVELFDWEYKDQQLSYLAYDINGAATFLTENAGKSSISGVESDVIWRATLADTISFRVQYLEATYDEYAVFTPFPNTSGCTFTPAVVAGRNVFLQDCSGFPMPYAPEWSGTVEYQHEFSLGGLGDLTFRVGAQFSSEYRLAIDARPQVRGGSYISPDVDLTYRTSDGGFSVMGYVRNANDEVIINSVNTGNGNAGIRAPRTYGVQMNIGF